MDAAASWQSAQAALAQSDMPGARRHLLRLLELQPGHRYARVMLAGTVLAQSRVREAVAQLRQAAAGSHDDPALLLRIAQALLRVGDSQSVAQLMHK